MVTNTFEKHISEGKSHFINGQNDLAKQSFVEASKLNSEFVTGKFRKMRNPFNRNDYQQECLDNGIITILNDIETSIENMDLQNMYNPHDRNFTLNQTQITAILKDYLIILNKCLIYSSKPKNWAYEYKLIGDIYFKLDEPKEAYANYKKSLYFNKSSDVKSKFIKLTNDFGETDKIDDENDFKYKLINNISFINIKQEELPKKTVKKQYISGTTRMVKENRVKFDINGKYLTVENFAMDYYAKQGYKSDHCEGKIFAFFHNFIFKDIETEYFDLKRTDYPEYLDIINKRINEFDDKNYRKIISKYYVLNKYKIDGYFDFIEYLGFNEWIGIMETIGIKKCLNYIKFLTSRRDGCVLPSQGMPDLIVYNEKEVFLVEVKSKNDTLSKDQIWQHHFLSDILDIPIVIFMVNKSEIQINAIKKQYLIK